MLNALKLLASRDGRGLLHESFRKDGIEKWDFSEVQGDLINVFVTPPYFANSSLLFRKIPRLQSI